MFSKLAVAFVATMAVFVAAAPSGGLSKSCNTGPVQCCNSLFESESEQANFLHQLIGVAVPINAFVGAQCSPISAIGIGKGSSCKTQPVCCDDNKFNGLIAVGCSPVGVDV